VGEPATAPRSPPADACYGPDDLQWACSEGIATVEECFGRGSDLDGNGIADVDEWW